MTKADTTFSVEEIHIQHAADVLKKLNSKWLEHAEKKPLLSSDAEATTMYLLITLKKIPKGHNVQMLKIPLRHTLVTSTTEICLITGDLDKRDRKAEIEPTVQHYKELLQRHKIKNISEIVPLRQLRTDYKSFEARRKLVAGYDVFLADERIAQCLPRCLGKFFFKKHKFPQQIRLKKINLHQHIEKVLSRTTLFLTGRGNVCSMEVAHVNWPEKHITENVLDVLDFLAKELPGSFQNLQGVYLKTAKSKAVPIYMSFKSGNDVVMPNPKSPPKLYIDHGFDRDEEQEVEDEEEQEIIDEDNEGVLKIEAYHKRQIEDDSEKETDNQTSDEKDETENVEEVMKLADARKLYNKTMIQDIVKKEAETPKETSKKKPIVKKKRMVIKESKKAKMPRSSKQQVTPKIMVGGIKGKVEVSETVEMSQGRKRKMCIKEDTGEKGVQEKAVKKKIIMGNIIEDSERKKAKRSLQKQKRLDKDKPIAKRKMTGSVKRIN